MAQAASRKSHITGWMSLGEISEHHQLVCTASPPPNPSAGPQGSRGQEPSLHPAGLRPHRLQGSLSPREMRRRPTSQRGPASPTPGSHCQLSVNQGHLGDCHAHSPSSCGFTAKPTTVDCSHLGHRWGALRLEGGTVASLLHSHYRLPSHY